MQRGRPAVRRRDDPLAVSSEGSSPFSAVDLDHDLVQRRLDVVAELVPLLRDRS